MAEVTAHDMPNSCLIAPSVATHGTYNNTKTSSEIAPSVEKLSRNARLNKVSSLCVDWLIIFTPGRMLNNILPERTLACTNPEPIQVMSSATVVGCGGFWETSPR